MLILLLFSFWEKNPFQYNATSVLEQQCLPVKMSFELYFLQRYVQNPKFIYVEKITGKKMFTWVSYLLLVIY